MSDKSGKSFEERVADVYRALEYTVTLNVDLAGNQTDLVAEKEIAGSSKVVLAVECKDHSRAISNETVNAFVNRVGAQTRARVVTGGVMVSSKGFTAKSQAIAATQQDITLLSISELTGQIFNIGLPLRELVTHYEEQEIFQHYLPLKVEAQSWSAGTKSSKPLPFDDLMDEVIAFDGRRGIGVILILADFGAGKTTLLRNVEYNRARAHLGGSERRVPLFVPLRDFRETQDIGVLLQTSFRNSFYRDLPLGVLWQRIESGSFYLLLDGFDEMVDRSDSARRLELFQALVPLLRSRSPVLLTSRPSYLVERGELQSLLEALRDEVDSKQTPIRGGPHEKVVAEHLRRKLFVRMQDEGSRHGDELMLNPDLVRVLRLTSLDWKQVEEFVGRHEADLASVGASVTDLIAFIERTYDLTDLATRPMLLRMIINTVELEAIDLGDTVSQFGASGLYELYTHEKLDFDISKIRGTHTGLEVDTRRRLAESLALEMYRDKTLETDFNQHLHQLATSDEPLSSALNRSGLSDDEIATDLAARSFVTVEDGICRFIHKSFRGFFVARVLKGEVTNLSPMFDERLENEVLYFLGGFAPTENSVGQSLWLAYRKTDRAAVTRRRNLLVAFLHTKPNHSDKPIEGTEIAEAEFGRLQFVGGHFTDVEWRDVTVVRMDLAKAEWRNVDLDETRFGEILAENCELDLRLDGSGIESWVCVETRGMVDGVRSTIDRWELERSSIIFRARNEVEVKELVLDRSSLTLPKPRTNSVAMVPARIGSATLALSGLKIPGETSPEALEAHDSVLVCASSTAITGNWKVLNSVLLVRRGPIRRKNRPIEDGARPSIDQGSVILVPDGVSPSLLMTRAGIFGAFSPSEQEILRLRRASAWGVLQAEDLLDEIGLSRRDSGCRVGSLLFVRRKPYRELTANELSAPRALRDLVSDRDFDPTDPQSLERAHLLRRSARIQYEALASVNWPAFFDVAGV